MLLTSIVSNALRRVRRHKLLVMLAAVNHFKILERVLFYALNRQTICVSKNYLILHRDVLFFLVVNVVAHPKVASAIYLVLLPYLGRPISLQIVFGLIFL